MKTELCPELFVPHPGLSDQINHNIIQSEIEGGVYLESLPEGTVLEMQTRNHRYRIVNRQRGQVLISGHPEFCPQPLPAHVHGSTWGGSMLKLGFIGRGMHLEFRAKKGKVITTTRIVDIREV